ncbi:MAG: Gfo/Idh/MocA family oxidoreductase [Actinomycetota bacterium]
MKPLGIGIIGCGKAGKYHAEWYFKNPDCVLRGFYNRSPLKAEELAVKYSARAYKEWEDLIKDPQINIISICTPVNQHKEQAVLALSHKKHVLCEKPMAVSSKECESMVNAAKENNVNLGVFFNMRFNPVVDAVNDNIDKIGKIISIDMSFQFNREELGWRGEQGMETGVLMELGTHAFDLAMCWLGDAVRIRSEIGRFKKNSYCEDHVFLICKFNNGAIGKFYISYNDPSFYDEQVEGLFCQILGEDGKICFLLNSYDPKKNRVFIIKSNQKEEIAIRDSKEYDSIYPGHMDSFGKLIGSFIKSVLENKSFIPSGEDGAKTIKFVEDAFKNS